jgi:hypothetical protein
LRLPRALAHGPHLDGVTCQFFANCKPRTANKVAYDTDMTARLWQVNGELAGMTPVPP